MTAVQKTSKAEALIGSGSGLSALSSGAQDSLGSGSGHSVFSSGAVAPFGSGPGHSVFYSLFQTSFGWCGIIYNRKGIMNFFLPETNKSTLKKKIHLLDEDAIDNPGTVKELTKKIYNYFKGLNVSFDYPLDLEKSTEFEKRVYKETVKIPFGKVKTYKWIAEKIGVKGGARAVGNALGKNSVPLIIPCHRVIGSNRSLGGFSATGGIFMKKRMLSLERSLI